MLMLQLLQNFQDFGSFKKKQDEVIKSTSVSTKNVDSKSIILLADGQMLQMPATTQKASKTKNTSEGPSHKGKRQSQHHQTATLSMDMEQVNTRNNEAATTKSFLNSQRITNLEGKLNGLSGGQQSKARAQASSKLEYDRSQSNMQEVQGGGGSSSLKKLASQELIFNIGATSQQQTAKKTQTLQKGKPSRSNMTPKLGIIG